MTENNGEESPFPVPQSMQDSMPNRHLRDEITENPWPSFKLCGNSSGCVSKAPKAGARLAGSSSQISPWLFLISIILLALFSQALHLEGTRPHRHLSLTISATSSQESSRKTMIGPEWVVCLTLRPGYGSPVFTTWDLGEGEGSHCQPKSSNDNNNVLRALWKD